MRKIGLHITALAASDQDKRENKEHCDLQNSRRNRGRNQICNEFSNNVRECALQIALVVLHSCLISSHIKAILEVHKAINILDGMHSEIKYLLLSIKNN